MKRLLIITGAVLALAAPAFAQDKTTLDYVTTKGTVVKANMGGEAMELPMSYKADGTYATSAMGQTVSGKWKIDGDKLCTESDMGASCTPYPAGKKPGDEFKVAHPALGEITVKINN